MMRPNGCQPVSTPQEAADKLAVTDDGTAKAERLDVTTLGSVRSWPKTDLRASPSLGNFSDDAR